MITRLVVPLAVRAAFLLLLFSAQLVGAQATPAVPPARQAPAAKGPPASDAPIRLDQQPSDQPPSGEKPAATFTTRSELVLVPVVVRKDGVHVPGLKKDAFRVLENGVEKKIAIFEEVRSSTASAAAPPPPLAPGEFSNAAAAAGKTAPQGLNIIVLSGSRVGINYQMFGQQELLKYLGRWAESREPITLLVLSDGNLHSLYDRTVDPQVLLAALRKINAKHAPAANAVTAADAAPALGTAAQEAVNRLAAALSDFRTFGGYDLRFFDDRSLEDTYIELVMSGRRPWPSPRERVAARNPTPPVDQRTAINVESLEKRMDDLKVLDAMRSLAQAYGGIPGRKSLIWVGSGFPPREGQLGDYVDRTWKLLNAANIAVYPVDSRGLMNPDPAAHAATATTAPDRVRPTEPPTFLLALSQLTMSTFADATGGRFFTNRNDLDKCLETAVKDSEDSYLLGYYFKRDPTAAAKSKDKNYLDYRKLQVKVAVKGVEVRARQGFAVGAGTDQPDLAKSARDEEAVAIHSSGDYTGIQFSGKWGLVTEGQDGKKRVEFELKLPPGFARLDETNGNRLDVDFVAVAKGPTGEVVSQASRELQVRIPTAQLPQYFKVGTVYRYVLELPPGEYTVRFIVRDNLTGQMGSVTTPLKVS